MTRYGYGCFGQDLIQMSHYSVLSLTNKSQKYLTADTTSIVDVRLLWTYDPQVTEYFRMNKRLTLDHCRTRLLIRQFSCISIFLQTLLMSCRSKNTSPVVPFNYASHHGLVSTNGGVNLSPSCATKTRGSVNSVGTFITAGVFTRFLTL